MIYAVSFASGLVIEYEDLPQEIISQEIQIVMRMYELREVEKQLIHDMLNSSVEKAAPLLGLSVPTLYRRIKKYGITI